MSWMSRINDIQVAAKPHLIHRLWATLIKRLRTADFQIDVRKSALNPSHSVNYLGLSIDFRRSFFKPIPDYIKTLARLLTLDTDKLSRRQSLSVYGFITFLFSIAARQYAALSWPFSQVLPLLKALFAVTAFRVLLRPPRTNDDPKTGFAYSQPLSGHQAHNELAALLAAFTLFRALRTLILHRCCS